jgi:hypothetical protein
MTPIIASFVAGTLCLAIGIALHHFFVQQIYPVLSERHEEAKVRLERGTSPDTLASLVQIVSLAGLPLIGFFIFGPLVRNFFGSH